MPQQSFPAVYMRGGTSKGVFFRSDWLPHDPTLRDRILLRVIGSPDPYGQHIDGMGGATSSTSKVVLLSASTRTDCDVDYRFGQVAIDRPVIDWSGNCGNLTAAVGPFAIAQGLVAAPADGIAVVRIWQANIQARIIAHVPMRGGEVVEDGEFELDGVTFPGAEIRLEFQDPGGDDSTGMFPTGNPVDTLNVPGVGDVELTLINAGNPAIFIEARALGLLGNELQNDLNANPQLLARAEAIRACAAVKMGLAATPQEATQLRPHTPKLAFVAAPLAYTAANGKAIDPATLDINARIFSMGKLHHAMTGTGAVAIAVAAAIPGTLVHRLVPQAAGRLLRFGHPSGSLAVGAEAQQVDGQWVVSKALMSRSARRLMQGEVLVPAQAADGVLA
ncbi:2-methylaconitate cis-trans isomerase PrpF [Pseudomonas sp. SDO528_S397]